MPVIMPVSPMVDDRAERILIYYTAPGPVKELDQALTRGLERVGYTLQGSGYLLSEGKRDMTFERTPPDQHIPHSNDPSTPPPQPKPKKAKGDGEAHPREVKPK